jgi:hypothetical protein
MSRRACLAVPAAVLALAGAAHASRPAAPAEAAGLRAAIQTYVGARRLPVSRFRIASARVSTVDPSWAAVRIDARRGRKDIGLATVVLRRQAWPGGRGRGSGRHADGAERWRVVTFGTIGSGCGVPAAVQADLHVAC